MYHFYQDHHFSLWCGLCLSTNRVKKCGCVHMYIVQQKWTLGYKFNFVQQWTLKFWAEQLMKQVWHSQAFCLRALCALRGNKAFDGSFYTSSAQKWQIWQMSSSETLGVSQTKMYKEYLRLKPALVLQISQESCRQSVIIWINEFIDLFYDSVINYI